MVALSKTDLKGQKHSLRYSSSTKGKVTTISKVCRLLLLAGAVVFLVLFGLIQLVSKVTTSDGSTSSSTKSLWLQTVLTNFGLQLSTTSTTPVRKKGPSHQQPQQPLCEECLEIVSQAQQIDITYVDIRSTYNTTTVDNVLTYQHPHMGATDAYGVLGYVADETSLRINPPKFNFPNIDNACSLRDDHYHMIHQKIIVEHNFIPTTKPINLFCIVYTTSLAHNQLNNIRETWGPKCDGFIVASNVTDPTLNTVNIVHKGEEAYNNIWQKVRSIWSYVYDNYYDKYDWFHIGGDDLFLIVENLKFYLDSEEIRTASNGGFFIPNGDELIQTPLFLGRRFAYLGDMNEIFNSGGSGYTMNKAALKTLVTLAIPNYAQNLHTFSEDTMVARLLKRYGIVPYETKDTNGGERYMPFAPGHHYSYRLPANKKDDWYAKYSINIKEGIDHCASRSIAFHYIKGNFMKRLFAMLYNLCPPNTV